MCATFVHLKVVSHVCASSEVLPPFLQKFMHFVSGENQDNPKSKREKGKMMKSAFEKYKSKIKYLRGEYMFVEMG